MGATYILHLELQFIAKGWALRQSLEIDPAHLPRPQRMARPFGSTRQIFKEKTKILKALINIVKERG